MTHRHSFVPAAAFLDWLDLRTMLEQMRVADPDPAVRDNAGHALTLLETS